jgi:hypothetical protein
MVARIHIRFIRFLYLLIFTFFIASCATTNEKKDEKYYAKQEEKQAKQEQKDYEAKLKKHEEIQSKETLKMMRDSKREARKLNKHKKT